MEKIGLTELADLWKCSPQEAGRRKDDDRGIKLSDIAKALDLAGVQLVDSDDVVVDRRKYESLLHWAEDGLNAERRALTEIKKRADD